MVTKKDLEKLGLASMSDYFEHIFQLYNKTANI